MMPPLSILGASALCFPIAESAARVDEAFEPLWAGRFRKIGHFIKLALAGAGLAVRHAGLTQLPARRTGVFLGTGLGNLSDLLPFADSLYDGSIPSPTQFANSVGNSGAFYIAQAYALEGPVLAISQEEVSFEAAVVNARLLLYAEEIDFALVGGIDVYMPPLGDHLARLGHDPKHEAALALADGVGFWVLSREVGEKSVARLLEASVGGGDPEATLARLDGPSQSLFVGERLRGREAPLRAKLGATLVPRCPGTFLTESAVTAGAFVTGVAPSGALYHSVAATREGVLGALTVRRAR